LTLDALIQQACEQYDVTVDAVLSSSKMRALSEARSNIARRAIDERVASIREVARALGRDPTGISKLVRRNRG
jgi:IS30 family transposase